LGIIYKLLEGSRGDGKKVVRKKDQKKSSQKVRKKVWQKGLNDSIAEYCIIAEVRKKFKKKVRKKVRKKVWKKYKLLEGGRVRIVIGRQQTSLLHITKSIPFISLYLYINFDFWLMYCLVSISSQSNPAGLKYAHGGELPHLLNMLNSYIAHRNFFWPFQRLFFTFLPCFAIVRSQLF
jgi:hypothetical protein